ncbi:hypothetical protein D3C81_857730 [compost metagenome]
MANLQRIGNPFGAFQVGRADRGHQAEAAVIGFSDCLRFSGEAPCAQHRAEDFFSPQAAVGWYVHIQRGADEPAFTVQRLAASQALQAFFACGSKVAGNLQPLRLAGQRAHVHFFVQRVAHPQVLQCCLQARQQRIGNAVLHQ